MARLRAENNPSLRAELPQSIAFAYQVTARGVGANRNTAVRAAEQFHPRLTRSDAEEQLETKMKRTPRPTRSRMLRPGMIASIGAACGCRAALLLWTSVAATPPTEAALLVPTGIGGSLLVELDAADDRIKAVSGELHHERLDRWPARDRREHRWFAEQRHDWSANGPGKIAAADRSAHLHIEQRAERYRLHLVGARNGGTAVANRQRGVLNYLRGDQTNEQSGANPEGLLRRAQRRLGAIVNSEIAYAGLEDFGYEALVDVNDLTSPASVAGLAYPRTCRPSRAGPSS